MTGDAGFTATEHMEATGPLARPGGLGARFAAGIRARPRLVRWLLAGPGAILAALATMAAMPLWMPAGGAGVNDIALPIILTPLLWAIPFFYACLTENLVQASGVICGATVLQAAAVAIALS
ncbi:MAG: hypothetical protein KDK03_11405 [Rhodobacteraceae bacterium]|nr:hypothetical protein [Paracoccaceae bacterium]